MNSSERLQSVFEGKPVDRRAWAPELNEHFVKKVLNDHGCPSQSGARDYAQACALIGADTLLGVEVIHKTYQDLKIENKIEGLRTTTTVETEKGNLTRLKIFNETSLTEFTTKHFLQEAKDFEPFKLFFEKMNYVLEPETATRAMDEVGARGIVSLFGPATPLMELIMNDAGLQQTIMLLCEYPRQMGEIMELMHERQKEYYRLLGQAPGMIVRPFEDTSTTLTSPAMYESYCAQPLSDYAEIVHRAGKKFVPHMCGALKQMLDILGRCQLDGIEAITPAPTGDVELFELRNALGAEAVLIGGIDPTLFSYCTATQIKAMLDGYFAKIKDDPRIIIGHEELSARADYHQVMLISEWIAKQGTDFDD